MSESVKAPDLFEGARDCCGCGSCAAACPKNAIAMVEDSRGFVFPRINEALCVGCRACIRACGLHAHLGGETEGPWYAAAGKGDVAASASGGVFATIARAVISEGGCAFGAAYEPFEGGLHVRHKMADDEDSLAGLLNSKYVQSDAGICFPDVGAQLRTGRTVFFCGTPCQVAGLKGYLGRDWPNLLTADLVCHGVPSQELFNGYLCEISKRYGSSVVDFRFRCKRDGWGHSLLLLLLLQDCREVALPAVKSPYYHMFLRLKTLRDSCYVCPYAGSYRAGDLTLGDFWGVETTRPDLIAEGKLDLQRGISCLLVNNRHGEETLNRYKHLLYLRDATFEEIANGNEQLRHPSLLPSDRDVYLDAYEKGGWPGIEHVWKHRETGVVRLLKRVAGFLLPSRIKRALKAAAR